MNDSNDDGMHLIFIHTSNPGLSFGRLLNLRLPDLRVQTLVRPVLHEVGGGGLKVC